MKTIIQKTTIEGRKVWKWSVKSGAKVLGGGLCASRTDAKNDAHIFASEPASRKQCAS